MATVAISLDDHNQAEVHLHGATLTSWKVDGEELTFVSRNAVFDGKKAIRGGIPVVFPNFGPWDLGPQHGFARTSTWKLAEPPSQGKPVAVFELEDSEQTRAMWNYRFKVRYSVIVGKHQLETKLDITNTGDQPFDFTTLLHTYFRLPDINKTTVDGLKGCAYFDKVLKEQKTENRELVSISSETDSMYAATASVHHITNGAGGYTFVVTKHNLPDTVVWNPWAEKAKAMSDFGDNEYMNMICVEAGYVTSRYVLQPKQTFSGGQTITLKK
jgi:glucose-6-phosphate 1-epimerase